MQRLIRAALSVAAILVATAGSRRAAAQDFTQPTITVTPAAGTYATGPRTVTIDWSDNVQLDAASRIITFGSADVTSAFSYSTTGNSTAQSSGTVNIQPGTNSFHAYICDGSANGPNCRSVFVTYVGPPPSVQVTADVASLSVPASTPAVTRYRVKNTGISTTEFTTAAACPSGFVDCATSTPTLTLVGGDSAWVDVSFTAPASGSGTVQLTAAAGSVSSTAGTTVSVAGAAPAIGFPGDSVSMQRIERDVCVTIAVGSGAASECGDLRVVYALPTTRVLNRARTPVLTYNSGHAQPYPIVAAQLAGPPGTVPDSITAVLQVNGTEVARQRHPGWGASQTRRIAVTFDAASYATGLYPYTLQVLAKTGGTQSTLQTQAGRMIVVNRAASPFGAGWWMAGVEQLVSLPGDTLKLWIGGDGSARLYHGAAGGKWFADGFDRPDSLYRETRTGLGQVYVRTLPGRAEVLFDAAGRHVRTISTLQHQTEFRWDAGGTYLQQVVLHPPSGNPDTTRYVFEYDNNPAAAVRNLSRVAAPGIGGARSTEFRADALGRLLRIVEPSGDSLVYAYVSGQRWMTRRTNRLGAHHGFGYLRNRFHTSTLQLNATDTAIVRVQAAQTLGMTSSVRPDSVWVIYDGARREFCDCTWWWVDRYGAPVQVRDPYWNQTYVQRADPRWPALVTRTQAPNGFTTTAAYDDRGRASSTTAWNPYGDGRHSTTSYTWDPVWDAPTRVVAPEGEVSLTSYDAYGRRSWEQVGLDAARRVNYAYNALNHATAPGLPVSVTLPGGAVEGYGYDARGNLNSVTNPLQVTSEFLSDGLGRVVRTRVPVGTTSVVGFQQDSSIYDISDQVLQTISTGPAMNGVGQQWLHVRNGYDREGNVLQVERWSIPDAANVDTITTRWEYDLAGRKVVEIAPDATPSTWTDNPRDSTFYDLASNPVRVRTRRFAESLAANTTDPAAAYVRMQYDASNRLIQRILPAVRYEAADTGLVSINHLGMLSNPYPEYENDGTGLKIPADTATFGYNSVGSQVVADNGNARVRRQFYLNGQLRTDSAYIRTVALDGEHGYGLEYRYDRNGRTTELRHPSQLRPASGAAQGIQGNLFSYDRVTGALAEVTDPLGYAFRYHYNVRGEPDSLQLPGGITHLYAYNAGGQMTRHRIRNATTGGSRYSDTWLRDETYGYDLQSRMVWSRNQYGLKDTLAVSYSGLGHMVASNHAFWGYNIVTQQETKYTAAESTVHDALGNIVSMQRQGSNRVYRSGFFYDGGHSWRDSNSEFGYEPSAGRLRERVEGGRGEWTEYDAGGNTIFTFVRPAPAQAGEGYDRVSYYDGGGRLWAVEARRVESLIAREAPQYFTFEEYRLDALGRRVLVRVRKHCEWMGNSDSQWCSLNSVRRTVWAGDSELYEIQMPASQAENDTAEVAGMPLYGNGYFDPNLQWGRVAYTYGGGIDRPLSVVRMGYVNRQPGEANGLFRWDDFSIIPHWNAHGRAQTGTFHSGVRSQCRAGYTNWCVQLSWPEGMFPYNPAPGALEHWHGTLLTEKRDASGLLYRRNRYYDPSTGRFTQEDPIGLAGGINVYGFAAGDPVNYSDPYGLCPTVEQCLEMAVVWTDLALRLFGGPNQSINLGVIRPDQTVGVPRTNFELTGHRFDTFVNVGRLNGRRGNSAAAIRGNVTFQDHGRSSRENMLLRVVHIRTAALDLETGEFAANGYISSRYIRLDVQGNVKEGTATATVCLANFCHKRDVQIQLSQPHTQ